ncbi:PepSY domain-containing protein [Neptunomonas sp.]|uniref:PepSY-associated TM helix domain-containing protein n=1 Tax=Neptunomonas sp. TaxID=1971898 RepID=UPI0025E3860D|nr:PepSY domain-containing protein [Neptunomonas sp.]
MFKQKDLNRWFWRWHIIAGLITLPIVLLLCITGILYLFKDDYNSWAYQQVGTAVPTANQRQNGYISFDKLLAAASQHAGRPIMQISLPSSEKEAASFRIETKGHVRELVYINPYTAAVSGEFNQHDSLMYSVRKLHGELLLHTPGTLVVELVASWFIILLITGIYIWWPIKKWSIAGMFTIRTKKGQRIFWRDIHSVGGFWLSIFMLIIIAGAMPWTNIFGGSLKLVQAVTDTGYPETWHKAPTLLSTEKDNTLSLEEIITIAQSQSLVGKLTLSLPNEATGTYRLANHSFWLRDQQVMYLDRFSGEVLKHHTWDDVGILMDLRQITMRLHQGEYGRASWYGVLIVSLLFTLSTMAGLISYLKRKPNKSWGFPTVPAQFKVGKALLGMILTLAILFPVFGISMLVIIVVSQLTPLLKPRQKVNGARLQQ